MKLWVYRVCFLAFALIIVSLTIWVSAPSIGGVHFQIDTSNVSINNTQIKGIPPSNLTVAIIDGNVVFAKVGLQNIPTLINGITASTSIIVAFSSGIIAYMFRELFPNDRKAKIAFFGISISFIYIFTYLFWVYVLLAIGLIDTALRWSLDGLLLSTLIFIGTILLGYYRLDSTPDKKPEKPDFVEKKDEKTEQEKKAPEVTVEPNEDEWARISYQEIGEDRRHFDSMLWEVPTAIFLVDSFLLGLVSSLSSYIDVQRGLLAFALFFTIFLTWSLAKIAKRSIDRVKMLKLMESEQKAIKYTRFPDEPLLLKMPVGYAIVGLLLVFAFFIILLMINPQMISTIKP